MPEHECVRQCNKKNHYKRIKEPWIEPIDD